MPFVVRREKLQSGSGQVENDSSVLAPSSKARIRVLLPRGDQKCLSLVPRYAMEDLCFFDTCDWPRFERRNL